jgi:hypothetical protein
VHYSVSTVQQYLANVGVAVSLDPKMKKNCLSNRGFPQGLAIKLPASKDVLKFQLPSVYLWGLVKAFGVLNLWHSMRLISIPEFPAENFKQII